MLNYLVYLTYCKICARIKGYKNTYLASLNVLRFFTVYVYIIVLSFKCFFFYDYISFAVLDYLILFNQNIL